VSPEERVLLSVHPGLEPEGRVLSKGGHHQAEEEGDQHKHGRQHDLQAQAGVKTPATHPGAI